MTTPKTAPSDGVTSPVSFPADTDTPSSVPPAPAPHAPASPSPASPPSDATAILDYVVKLQQRLTGMGNDEIAAYVAQYPDFVGELAEALRTTRSLGVLGVLNQLDALALVPPEIIGWARAYMGTASWDSDKPDHIQPATAELPAPPLPPSIAPVVRAVAESSRCSLATALAGVLGGINLCVAEEYDVQALARLPVPTSLYIVASSESGWRKSEALGCGFSAHDAADNAIEASWRAAKKAADTDADTAKAADRSPVALRDNSTIPALLRALAWGRRTQGLKMTEASTLFAEHSFSHGRVDSMGELTKLWDGVPSSVLRVRDDNLEFRLSGQRLTMCTVGQPAVVDKVIFSDDAANGFGPRLLYSADTERPKQLRFEWQDGQNPDSVIRGFEGEIARIRGLQDKGMEYDECLVYDRRALQPTDEARAMLVAFNEECEIASDTADSNHLRGFLVRSAEQAARIAGNLAGWRLLTTSDDNLVYGVDDLAPAIGLVRWYGQIVRLSVPQCRRIQNLRRRQRTRTPACRHDP